MANRYAVATGNWSNTATWDGSTLPQAGDVVRPNAFTVNIDQDITVAELRNNASAPAVQGGVYTFGAGITINADITHIIALNSDFITATYGSGTSTINGDVILAGSTGDNTKAVLLITGSAGGVLIVNGDIYMSNTTNLVNERGSCVRLNGNGNGFKITCNGLVSGALALLGAFTAEGNTCGIAVAGQNYVIELNGVTQGSTVLANTVNSNGVIVFSATTGNTIVNNGLMQGGTVNTANFGDAVNMPTNLLNFLNNYGTIVASATQRGMVGGLLTHYSGAIVTDNFVQAASHPKAQRLSTSFMDASFNLPITSLTNGALRTPGLLTGYPLVANVETGTVYGPASEFTGTLNPVTVNVTVDTNAIAAAISTSLETSLPPLLAPPLATDLLAEISTSADPLAERLRNASTVQTTGAQLQSLVIAP
jgi:hypothetical protein